MGLCALPLRAVGPHKVEMGMGSRAGTSGTHLLAGDGGFCRRCGNFNWRQDPACGVVSAGTRRAILPRVFLQPRLFYASQSHEHPQRQHPSKGCECRQLLPLLSQPTHSGSSSLCPSEDRNDRDSRGRVCRRARDYTGNGGPSERAAMAPCTDASTSAGGPHAAERSAAPGQLGFYSCGTACCFAGASNSGCGRAGCCERFFRFRPLLLKKGTTRFAANNLYY